MHLTVHLRLPVFRQSSCIAGSRIRAGSVEGVQWEFGFQCNEHYLKWDRSAQSQFVKPKLTPKQFQSCMMQLTVVVPDLSERLDTMKATLLIELMRDPNNTAEKIVEIKTALPNLDVGGIMQDIRATYRQQFFRFYSF